MKNRFKSLLEIQLIKSKGHIFFDIPLRKAGGLR